MGVGVSMVLLLALSTSVVVLILVVVVRRKRANKQKEKMKMEDNLYYNNTVVVEQEMVMKEKSVIADYKDVHVYDDPDAYVKVDNEKSEEDDLITDEFHPYEVVDRKESIKRTKTPAPKRSSSPSSATNVHAVYAVVDKKKKSDAMVEEESSDASSDQYAMPMEKMGKITGTGEGVFVSGGTDEYGDTPEPTHKPEVLGESGQHSE